MVTGVVNGRADYRSVRHDKAPLVQRLDQRREKPDLHNIPGNVRHRDRVSNGESSKEQEHHPGGKVYERALQHKTDRADHIEQGRDEDDGRIDVRYDGSRR